jgi:phosphoribosylformylglycinamidine synthase subunit PurL
VDLSAAAGAPEAFRVNATLFGESASRIVVSVRPEHLDGLRALAGELGVPLHVVGTTGGDRITIKVDGLTAIDVPARDAEARWSTAIEKVMSNV